MLIRFFYFPTPTYTGCADPLEAVKFDDCAPLIKLSEIRRIFVAKVIAAAFTDWTDDAEWTGRLSQSSTAGDDYIRTLIVRGNKPAPAPVTKEISNGRKITLTKNHTLNATIDEVWEENHEFMRQVEAGGQFKIWYETHGGLMFGGNDGIIVYMRIDMSLPEGTEELMTYPVSIEWKNKFTEERIDSPIFAIGTTGSATVYDTTLEFSADVDDTAAGVTATISAIDPDMEFQFDAIAPQVGTPETMEINLGGILVMTVDFTTDYLGEPFRFVDTSGTSHNGVFAAGNVNF